VRQFTPTPNVASPDQIIASYSVTADFGADPTGVNDSTVAFQKALFAAYAQGGGVVFAAAGTYKLSGRLYVPDYVVLRGEWQAPPLPNGGPTVGTIINVFDGQGSADGLPFIYMDYSAGVRDLNFFYPNQQLGSSTAVAFPWTIAGHNGDGGVQSITLVNSYRGISYGPWPNWRHYIRDIYGSPLETGVRIDNCVDFGRILHVHFLPTLWPSSGLLSSSGITPPAVSAVQAVTLAIGTAFALDGTDDEQVYDIEADSYAVGIHGTKSDHLVPPAWSVKPYYGSCYGFTLTNCDVGIKLEYAQEFGNQFTHGSIVGAHTACVRATTTWNQTGNPPAPYTPPNGTQWRFWKTMMAQFQDVTFDSGANNVLLEGTGGLSFQDCTFQGWSSGGNAIHALQGVLSVVGCTVKNSNTLTALKLDSGCASVLVSGDVFSSTANAVDASDLLLPSPSFVLDTSPPSTPFEHVALNLPVEPLLPKPAGTALKSVVTFGANGNDWNDDTAAFQAAITAMGSSSGTIYVPAGNYMISGTLVIPANVELRGVGDVQMGNQPAGGSVLVCGITGSTVPVPTVIALNPGAGVRGIKIMYANQDYRSIVPNAFAITGLGNNIYVVDTFVMNGTGGLDLFSSNCSGHYVRGLRGCFTDTLVHVGATNANGTGGGWIMDCHQHTGYWSYLTPNPNPSVFLPAAIPSDDNYVALDNVTGTTTKTYWLGQVDDEILLNNTAWACKNGLFVDGQLPPNAATPKGLRIRTVNQATEQVRDCINVSIQTSQPVLMNGRQIDMLNTTCAAGGPFWTHLPPPAPVIPAPDATTYRYLSVLAHPATDAGQDLTLRMANTMAWGSYETSYTVDTAPGYTAWIDGGRVVLQQLNPREAMNQSELVDGDMRQMIEADHCRLDVVNLIMCYKMPDYPAVTQWKHINADSATPTKTLRCSILDKMPEVVNVSKSFTATRP
jgi:hypothetical protein